MIIDLRNLRRALWLTPALALLLQLGCSGGDDDDTTPGDDDATQTGDDDASQPGDDDASQTGDDDGSSSPTPEYTLAPSALITTTNYSSGGLTTISLEDFQVAADQLALGGDTIVRTHDQDVYLLVRDFATGNDYVSQVDPDHSFTEIHRIDTGTGSNPHDVAFASGKGYISLYGNATNMGGVAVFDPATGSISHTIDLSDYADADGNANADSLALDGTTLYAGLQRVNYNDFSYDSGMIAVIDTSSDTVTKTFPLTGTNVGTILVESSGNLLVATSGVYGMADGGIERIDTSTGESSGFLLTEADLGVGDTALGSVVVVNGKAYVIGSTGLASFDPADGSGLTTVSATSSIMPTGLWAHGSRLWLADTDGNVWVYDTTAGTLLTNSGLDAGAANPYSMAFHD